jgi:putative membrane protein
LNVIDEGFMNQPSANAPDKREGLAGDRTTLAIFRTQLALDRTTLAWIRTALTMGTFGFGLVAFFRSVRQVDPSAETIRVHQGAILFGTSLVILGIVAMILTGLLHLLTLGRLRQGKLPALSLWPLSVTVAMLLAVVGLVGLWLLLVR